MKTGSSMNRLCVDRGGVHVRMHPLAQDEYTAVWAVSISVLSNTTAGFTQHRFDCAGVGGGRGWGCERGWY